MFNVALRECWINRNPFSSAVPLISLADEQRRERILTRDEETRLLAESRQLVVDTVDRSTVEERGDYSVIKEKIRKDLKKYFLKQTAKRPFILPVIMEI